VIDFDGCATTVQYNITGLSEEGIEEISIYPNPFEYSRKTQSLSHQKYAEKTQKTEYIT
jgi:hypothetical protein